MSNIMSRGAIKPLIIAILVRMMAVEPELGQLVAEGRPCQGKFRG